MQNDPKHIYYGPLVAEHPVYYKEKWFLFCPVYHLIIITESFNYPVSSFKVSLEHLLNQIKIFMLELN